MIATFGIAPWCWKRWLPCLAWLAGVDAGTYPNVAAPQLAIDYWHLAPGALLREVIVVIRADEAQHRDVNHKFADALTGASAR